MMKDRCAQGFTLIELMVVIAIIGILAAIAIPQFNVYRVRGYNALAVSDVKNASIAQEAYYVDHRTYTSEVAMLTTFGFRQTQGVAVQIPSKDDSSYTITANHNRGDKTYTLTGPGGAIISD